MIDNAGVYTVLVRLTRRHEYKTSTHTRHVQAHTDTHMSIPPLYSTPRRPTPRPHPPRRRNRRRRRRRRSAARHLLHFELEAHRVVRERHHVVGRLLHELAARDAREHIVQHTPELGDLALRLRVRQHPGHIVERHCRRGRPHRDRLAQSTGNRRGRRQGRQRRRVAVAASAHRRPRRSLPAVAVLTRVRARAVLLHGARRVAGRRPRRARRPRSRRLVAHWRRLNAPGRVAAAAPPLALVPRRVRRHYRRPLR